MVNRNRWPDAAEAVRNMIASGELKPGDLTPSARTLSALTGAARATCRKALLLMSEQGELVPPLSRGGRPRVPGGDSPGPSALALAAALAAAREAAGLTQVQLAERTGVSVSALHYAETGLFRRPTPEEWATLDQATSADGSTPRSVSS